jgi:hypothetical protein
VTVPLGGRSDLRRVDRGVNARVAPKAYPNNVSRVASVVDFKSKAGMSANDISTHSRDAAASHKDRREQQKTDGGRGVRETTATR